MFKNMTKTQNGAKRHQQLLQSIKMQIEAGTKLMPNSYSLLDPNAAAK